jgi:iron complex transport system ATP-binding protein
MALEADSVGFYYRKDEWVFQNVSASVAVGQVLAILGPNGCGKTTLLKCLLGLIQPRQGAIARGGSMALVPQLFQVAFAFSALDMVLMGRAKKIGLFSQPSKLDRRLALEALSRFQVADLADRSFHELSGGQRQLVMLARALVAEADILVLDEPTSALDLKNQEMILEWLSRLSQESGLTIVFTTHLPQHALIVADQALLMVDRENYVAGPVDEAMSEENLKRLYGVAIKRVSLDLGGEKVDALIPLAGRRKKRLISAS